MLSILSFLTGLFPTITSITNAISNERIAALNATTQQEQIASNERIAALTAQQQLLIAEGAHSRLPVIIQTVLALGPTIYLTKIFIWDKVLDMGSTDHLDPHLWYVVMAVIGFYFLSTARLFK